MKTMTFKIRNTTKLLLTISALLMSYPTFAIDAKEYSGHGCSAKYGSHSQYLSYTTAGLAYNNSYDRGIYVVCPIVRDSTTKNWNLISIEADDWNASRDVKCTFNNMNKSGGWGGTQTHVVWSKTLGTSGTGFAKSSGYTFYQPYVTNPSVNRYSAYTVQCYLPARTNLGASGIVRISMREDN